MTTTSYATLVDPCDATTLSLQSRRRCAEIPTRLRFSGFGLFRAEVDGKTAGLPPITRTVLAQLVLARGGMVDIDDLYCDSWPEPARTIRREQRVAVHKRIADLRRRLVSDATSGHTGVLLTERSSRTGYRLILDTDQVDIHTFEALVFRASGVQDAVAVDLLVQALLMWTERPLLGLPDKAFVRDHVVRLTRLRDRACRELAAGCRTLGRIKDALNVFDHLQAIHPADIALRELTEHLCGDARSITPMTHPSLAS